MKSLKGKAVLYMEKHKIYMIPVSHSSIGIRKEGVNHKMLKVKEFQM